MNASCEPTARRPHRSQGRHASNSNPHLVESVLSAAYEANHREQSNRETSEPIAAYETSHARPKDDLAIDFEEASPIASLRPPPGSGQQIASLIVADFDTRPVPIGQRSDIPMSESQRYRSADGIFRQQQVIITISRAKPQQQHQVAVSIAHQEQPQQFRKMNPGDNARWESSSAQWRPREQSFATTSSASAPSLEGRESPNVNESKDLSEQTKPDVPPRGRVNARLVMYRPASPRGDTRGRLPIVAEPPNIVGNMRPRGPERAWRGQHVSQPLSSLPRGEVFFEGEPPLLPPAMHDPASQDTAVPCQPSRSVPTYEVVDPTMTRPNMQRLPKADLVTSPPRHRTFDLSAIVRLYAAGT
uniref:Uncharacterized protein n=1 Tax=Glossina morsitans morsitans TaxID=37546 RepID=A0A1B0FDB8_GLOMM